MQWFMDGGVFNLAGLAWFCFGVGAIVVQHATRDRTRFPGLNAGLVTGVLGIGLLGAWMGAILLAAAVDNAGHATRLPLLVSGTSVLILPIGFTALFAKVLYVMGQALPASEPAMAAVRPARAVMPVTVGAATCLMASMVVGVAVSSPALRSAAAGMAPTGLGLLQVAAGLAAVSVGLSALNVAMGLIGGARGWLAH